MEESFLSVNVGGQVFHIRASRLAAIPGSLLTQLVDSTVPFDLVFGGRAISLCDTEEDAENDHTGPNNVGKMGFDPIGSKKLGNAAQSLHPYERAKYVYLSANNSFRRLDVPSNASSNTDTTQGQSSVQGSNPRHDDPSRTAAGTSYTATDTPLTNRKPLSTRRPCAPETRSPNEQCLYLPATRLTLPHHKMNVTRDPSSSNKNKNDGLKNSYTNNGFLPGDEAFGGVDDKGRNIDSNSQYEHPNLTPSWSDEASHQQFNPLDQMTLPHAYGADVYVDRNYLLVPYIFDLYRHGQLHLPANICSISIRKELEFWKIPEELISECCWREYESGLDRMKTVRAISATLTNRYDDPEVRSQLTKFGRFWITMERPSFSRRAKIWCGVYYTFILLSILTFMLLTLSDFLEVKPEFKDLLAEYTANGTRHVVHYGTFTKAVDWLEGTEIGLDIFFTLEFAARLITCPDKKGFVRNKHNIIDVVILTTAWTRCIYDRIITMDSENFTQARSFVLVVLNCMLGLRVLRMLHLAKIFRTLKVMYLSILASLQELALLVVVMVAAVLLFGTVLYIAEGFSTPDDEPLAFTSVPIAMWWAVITLTTVGYGDYYPVHAAGYAVGAICAVAGLLLVAMPIAIVASNFSNFYDNMASNDQSKRRRTLLGKLIGVAMAKKKRDEDVATLNKLTSDSGEETPVNNKRHRKLPTAPLSVGSAVVLGVSGDHEKGDQRRKTTHVGYSAPVSEGGVFHHYVPQDQPSGIAQTFDQTLEANNNNHARNNSKNDIKGRLSSAHSSYAHRVTAHQNKQELKQDNERRSSASMRTGAKPVQGSSLRHHESDSRSSAKGNASIYKDKHPTSVIDNEKLNKDSSLLSPVGC